MVRTFFCFLLESILLDTVVGYGILGFANMNFQYMEECEEPVHIIEYIVTQRKYNRTTHVLDIIFNTPLGFGDFITLEIKGSVKKQGGYKPGVSNVKGPACTMSSLVMGDIFTALLQGSGFENCPMPPGNYSLLNFHFDNEKYNVPQVYGEYKSKIMYFMGQEMVMCYYVYYEVVPRPQW